MVCDTDTDAELKTGKKRWSMVWPGVDGLRGFKEGGDESDTKMEFALYLIEVTDFLPPSIVVITPAKIR